MGLITRGSRSYYYRSKRVDGEVKTEVFSGLGAILEAQADEEARQDEIDCEIEKLFAKIEEITAERLHAAGYHRHKREWRKRRAAG